MVSIYGNVIRNAWRVEGKDIIASYPPLGYYEEFRNKIFDDPSLGKNTIRKCCVIEDVLYYVEDNYHGKVELR